MGTNLDFQMEQSTYRRKSDGLCITDLKRIREKLLRAAHALAGSKLQLMSAPCAPGTPASGLCRGLLLPPEPLLSLVTTLLEPSRHRSRELSRSNDFWWSLAPRLTTSLSQRHLMPTCLPLSPYCADSVIPCNEKGAHSMGEVLRGLA